jgi:FkbM family methyltransferase
VHQRPLEALGHRYPFFSGCGWFANHWPFANVAGNAQEIALARLQTYRLETEHKLYVDLSDHLGKAVYFFGDLDPKVTWAFQRLLRPGDVVLDIGANVGLMAVIAAGLVGPTGKVHAFEPQPSAVNLLRKSIYLNGLHQIEVHEVALGSADGRVQLFIPEGNAGRASITRRDRCGREIMVSVRHAGDYLSSLNLSGVRLMKLDIEGYEGEVIRAARDFLDRQAPGFLLFEINDYSLPFSDQSIIQDLWGLGYHLYEIALTAVGARLNEVPGGRFKDRCLGHDILACSGKL